MQSRQERNGSTFSRGWNSEVDFSATGENCSLGTGREETGKATHLEGIPSFDPDK